MKEEEQERQRLENQRINWEAEELLKRQPPTPFPFSSQQEKRLRAEHAVSRRIDNAMAAHRENARQRRMEFLERAASEPRNHASAPLPEADRERLKQAYRDAADRRRSPENDRRRNRGRDGR